MLTNARSFRRSLTTRFPKDRRHAGHLRSCLFLVQVLGLALSSRVAFAQGEGEPEPASGAPPSAPVASEQAARASESLGQKPAVTSPDVGAAVAEPAPGASVPAPPDSTQAPSNTEGARSKPSPTETATPSAGSKPPPTETATPSAWHFGGYGELLLMTSFYHPDLTRRDNNYRDTRLDLRRIALEIDAELTESISFHSEVEIEHGGTGVTREIEWEEFGEYETEVEKGGEIALEEAYLEGRLTPWLSVSAGHLLIPVGMTVGYHKPNLFSSTRRPESESHLIPSLWHENGVGISLQTSGFRARLQAVTGLDSTGFSSSHWIAGGTQRAFEEPQMNDIATVVALDYTGVPGLLLGTSFYTSGTNKNRPKRDLYDVSGRVTLGDLHARFQRGPLKLRGVVLLGHLENAAAITRANASLSSDLGASRTAVGRGAYATWLEVAYDILPLIAGKTRHALDIFARFDAFDTMWKAGSSFDNPMMQRRTVTTGLNYFPHPRVVLKGEYVSRWLNESKSWDRRQSEVNAALGFVL